MNAGQEIFHDLADPGFLIVIVIVATLTAAGTIVIDPIHGIPTEIVIMIVLIRGM
jgi:hypothetical protein